MSEYKRKIKKLKSKIQNIMFRTNFYQIKVTTTNK